MLPWYTVTGSDIKFNQNKDTAPFNGSFLSPCIRSFLFLAEQVKFGPKPNHNQSSSTHAKQGTRTTIKKESCFVFHSLFIASHKAISNATNHQNTKQLKLFWIKTVNKALLRTVIKWAYNMALEQTQFNKHSTKNLNSIFSHAMKESPTHSPGSTNITCVWKKTMKHSRKQTACCSWETGTKGRNWLHAHLTETAVIKCDGSFSLFLLSNKLYLMVRLPPNSNRHKGSCSAIPIRL